MDRIGFAKDVHQLVANRRLILCGVEIPFEKGLLGHSDADVALHAVAESILGALALGDLGKFYPVDDPKYLNYNSCLIVSDVVSKMQAMDYEIANIDVSIICETPHLSKYIEEMRAVLATLLKTGTENVSIKAGTNEELDAVGEGKAIEAYSVVLLKKRG